MEEPIHVYIPASEEDPRETPPAPPGVIIHRGPPLHPDDTAIVRGLPVTSVGRTLIDCAECADIEELREMFLRAQAKGLLDMAALRASRARVEWRPSLQIVDILIDEFSD